MFHIGCSEKIPENSLFFHVQSRMTPHGNAIRLTLLFVNRSKARIELFLLIIGLKLYFYQQEGLPDKTV